MYFMFSRAERFNQPLDWDTASVVTMVRMFTHCIRRTRIEHGTFTNRTRARRLIERPAFARRSSQVQPAARLRRQQHPHRSELGPFVRQPGRGRRPVGNVLRNLSGGHLCAEQLQQADDPRLALGQLCVGNGGLRMGGLRLPIAALASSPAGDAPAASAAAAAAAVAAAPTTAAPATVVGDKQGDAQGRTVTVGLVRRIWV